MKVVTCRSCKAWIFWAVTEKGKKIPIDVEPCEDGNVTVLQGIAVCGSVPLEASGAPRHKSHFATCKQAREWRRSELRAART